MERVWGMLATYRSDGACWNGLVALCLRRVGTRVGRVGAKGCMLQVLWGAMKPIWGCVLATYMSYGVCSSHFGAVCWQPTSLMGCVGASLGLHVRNLQV